MPHDLESGLEGRFARAVQRELRGKAVKLAPTEKGTPDRMVLLPGGVIRLVELKTDSGRVSPAQRLWHDRAASRYGTEVEVLRGRDQIDEWVARWKDHLTPDE